MIEFEHMREDIDDELRRRGLRVGPSTVGVVSTGHPEGGELCVTIAPFGYGGYRAAAGIVVSGFGGFRPHLIATTPEHERYATPAEAYEAVKVALAARLAAMVLP